MTTYSYPTRTQHTQKIHTNTHTR